MCREIASFKLKEPEDLSEFELRDHLKELTVAGEVDEYAEKMHNCARSYIDRIINHTALLFVMELPDQDPVMIEVSPETGKIVQARGPYNLAPESEVVRKTLTRFERFMMAHVQKKNEELRSSKKLQEVQG